MTNEVKELKEAVEALTMKVEELYGLSKQVAEITSGVNLMREMFLRLEAGPSKRQKCKVMLETPETGKAKEEAKTESDSGMEKEEFERLLAPLKDALEECLIRAFINVLKVEVQVELKMVKVKMLDGIMEKVIYVDKIAQMLDEEKSDKARETQTHFWA